MPRKPKNDSSGNNDGYLPHIGIRLPADQIEALDRKAKESRGRLNRSDLIRQAIDQFLKREKD